ncbi:chymotrypsin inhibitor isoform X2 [Megalopta genalis]|uniref:chymotrypsin inhibitor isoform X2 n=1 Tax=Megalopta genalis TaxID=115081 RepID=UPI0014436899|nr:chymotrypsin inhibitor-like [Megalopta genalis]
MARCAVGIVLLAMLLLAALAEVEASSIRERCPQNEMWTWCGKRCEPTCKVPVPTEKTCPEMECNPLKSDCRCKEGYVRNEQNICVHVEKCKK